MRGREELQRLVSALEEIVAAIASDGTSPSRLHDLALRHGRALRAVEALGRFDEDESAALEPLLGAADRLNALAVASTRVEAGRLEGKIERVHSAADRLKRRSSAATGRSCDVAG